MDANTGNFHPLLGEPIAVGEAVEFKGMKFRIERIDGDTVTLKWLRSLELRANSILRAPFLNRVRTRYERRKPTHRT